MDWRSGLSVFLFQTDPCERKTIKNGSCQATEPTPSVSQLKWKKADQLSLSWNKIYSLHVRCSTGVYKASWKRSRQVLKLLNLCWSFAGSCVECWFYCFLNCLLAWIDFWNRFYFFSFCWFNRGNHLCFMLMTPCSTHQSLKPHKQNPFWRLNTFKIYELNRSHWVSKHRKIFLSDYSFCTVSLLLC